MAAVATELPDDLKSFELNGLLTVTEVNGGRSFHVSKKTRYFFALGKRREDLGVIYASKVPAEIYTDPVDVFALSSAARVYQSGDSEFSITFPSFTLSLGTPDAVQLSQWISGVNAVIGIAHLLEQQNLHAFKRHHFPKFTWCSICKEFIWGLGYQGYLCTSCERAYHPKCMGLSPADCTHKAK